MYELVYNSMLEFLGSSSAIAVQIANITSIISMIAAIAVPLWAVWTMIKYLINMSRL